MSAEDKDTEEAPETPSEEKPKRRGLRSRAKQADEADQAAEEKPKSRGRKARSKPKEEGAEKPEVDTKAKPEVEATSATETTPETKAEAKPEVEAKPKAQREPKPKPAARADGPGEGAAPPAQPTPAPRRQTREPGAAPAVVRARAKYVRTSARKARLVCDHIRGKSVDDARAILAFAPRAVARDWSKLLESAVANAEHNHELVGDDLRIEDVYADEGPTLKRYRPRAMGRATRIRKRTSHLTITLTPKENA